MPGYHSPKKKHCFKMKAGKEGPMKKNFPDLSGDGKVTQKDILMGKGVIPSPKKKYKSDAQRKAVHASKAEQAAMKKKGSAYKMYGEDSPMKKYMNKRMKSNKPCTGCKTICPSCRGKK